MSRPLALSPLLMLLVLSGRVAAGDASTPEFFEKKIRPVLVAQCYGCHSADAAKAKKLRGGLALDTREALRAGGDTGAALVPGKPAESLLIQSLKYAGDLKMPPTGKLPDAVVADFEAWVAAGAPDPRTGAVAVKKQVGPSVAEGKNFWAYKPIPLHDPRATLDSVWLKGLEAKKLSPAPAAGPGVWLRRVTFDLSGLPPTVAEIDAFRVAHDQNADTAAAAVVDRLLASPAFGERWGRHWLDVARYADSVTLRGSVFPQAWRYRDYVIDSLNADRPFDRMVREQIAGDLLPSADPAEQARGRVATAFLALGNTNLEEQDKKQLRMDVVDEQLDVITKGFLAQTVTCARCHDHKFDPIPTRDYYALAGILRNAKALETANVSRWIEVPLPATAAEDARYAAAEKRVAALTESLKHANAKKPAAKGVLAVKDVPGLVIDDARAKRVGAWKESAATGVYIGAGYLHDDNDQKGDKTLTFQPDAAPVGGFEVLLAYSHSPSRDKAVPVTVFGAEGEKTVRVDMRSPPAVEGRYASLGVHRFEKDGQCYVTVSNEGTTGHVTADAVVFRVPGTAAPAPAHVPAPGGGKAEPKATDLKPLEAELKALTELLARRPRAMSVVEEAKIEDLRVHVRGGVHTLGEPAPRGVLQVASLGPVAMPAGQSGRLQLADWVASRDNPLTARVAVNRAWHWILGAGLVRTVDNFGLTGESPSHPELLDHLASQFADDGWSTKRLVRRIVLSRAYRQSSEVSAAARALDPENRAFARANRRRLEGEAIRDAMLAVSGKLDRTPGGPGFPAGLAADYGYAAESDRRTVYLPMFRNAMPELLATFDGADPSVVTGQRNAVTVAPQALYLMNHPFPATQARHAAARHLAGASPGDLDAAYLETLGRPPTPGETAATRRHLARHPDPLAGWTGVYHALFASADFRTLD